MATTATPARVGFAPVYKKDLSKPIVFTGCIIRRFSAAFFDAVVFTSLWVGQLYALSLPFPKNAEGVTQMPPLLFIGSVLLCVLGYLYLPELFFRQTLGMALFDVEVVCPSTFPAWAALLIRRGVTAIEFLVVPDVVYYLLTACSRTRQSLSDRASGCWIVRKKYFRHSQSKRPKGPSQGVSVLVALLFTLLPWILFLGLFLAMFGGMIAFMEFFGDVLFERLLSEQLTNHTVLLIIVKR